jgi:hypothetical protein
MRYFECSIEGHYPQVIQAATASKARYLYWIELADVFGLPYSECFRRLRARVSGMPVQPKDVQQELVNKINAAYGVGDAIKVQLDSGEIVTWTVKHPATMLGGHTAVIWIKEHASCYNASRVINN